MLVSNTVTTIRNIKPDNLIRYWPLDDLTGTSARDISPYGEAGSYTNLTIADQPGIDGRPAPEFTDNNSYVGIGTNLATDLGAPQKGTIVIAGKVSAQEDWETGAKELVNLYGDANNYVRVGIGDVDNEIIFLLRANSASQYTTHTYSSPDTDWIWYAFTWDTVSATTNQFLYINGVSLGYTAHPANSLQTALGTSSKVGTEQNGTDREWLGSLAHVALWNDILSTDEIRTIHTQFI